MLELRCCGVESPDAIGPDNPLAATTFAFLAAATNIPMTYLTFIDGRAYAAAGIKGMLFTDAAVGILACIVAAILFAKFDSTADAEANFMVLPPGES